MLCLSGLELYSRWVPLNHHNSNNNNNIIIIIIIIIIMKTRSDGDEYKSE